VNADPHTPLTFPDAPKLELDELIDQLIERALGVKRAQGRLRGLLRAIETVTGDLSLESVLRNVIEAACDLAEARYGAVGVIAQDGSLEQFIHVGMDQRTARGIGALPQGKGLLGALINDPQPIRLRHMAEDPRSAGFPPQHPAMDSFLGVPIRVRGEVFGNLYLTDSTKGEFTADDEELVVALAFAAGSAVSNARLYQESRLRQQWLTASVEISAQLLAATGEDPLQMIARRAIDIADADLVSLGLLTPDGTELVVEIALGVGAEELIGRRFLVSEIAARRAIEEHRPVMLSSLDVEGHQSHVASVIEAGPLMLLPLQGTQQVHGVLSLVRTRGRAAFTASDLNLAAGFANHASVALELADSRAAEQRVALLEDRERIARDLHDHVIQELFAIGLGLESAAVLIADHPAEQRVRQRVADIDRTIRRIRTSIFELRGPIGTSPEGVRQRIFEIAADLTPALGFAPDISFSGLVEIKVSPELADDLAAAVREALTNCAKHARASKVSVDVSVSSDEVVLIVSDDGVGIGAAARTSGLANLAVRADKHGGSLETTSGNPHGTTLTWKAPLT
jgi:signal transduction histidine kinase